MADVAGHDLSALARPSGALAMLALDQRESLRAMLRAATGSEPSRTDVERFKVQAAGALTPRASAVLLDVETGLGPVNESGAIAPGCGVIVAADRLTQAVGGPVEDTETDDAVLADDAVAGIANAYKLLVIWRPDEGRPARERTVKSFLEGCRRRGKPGIVEAIVRAPAGQAFEREEHVDRVLEAAEELAAFGPDVYKAEVPTLGAGTDEEITAAARRLSDTVACPWVVLSNGTPADRFADAAVAACRGGASGFLAGRALWAAGMATAGGRAAPVSAAAARLRDLVARIDAVARPWTES